MVNAVDRKNALDKIYEHSRDFLKLKVELPLGDPDLKKVHTNQFLFTHLPSDFGLVNWETIGNALSSNYNRYSGAKTSTNRWYIEGCTVDVDVKGTGKMSLDTNAFASTLKSYSEAYKGFQDAINNNSSTTNNSSTKNKTNATTTNNGELLNQSNIKKYSIPKQVYSKAEEVCKGKKTDKDKAYALYKWMDNHVGYSYYTNHQRSETTVMNKGSGNCVDNSRLYRLLCLSVGIKCTFLKSGSCCCTNGRTVGHQFNKVYIDGKGITVDCGRSMASWGSHWGNCSGIYENTSSW